jgi:hypothetical protein
LGRHCIKRFVPRSFEVKSAGLDSTIDRVLYIYQEPLHKSYN